MISIVADNKIPFLKGALERVANIEYLPGRDIGPRHVREADALILRTRTRCDEKLLGNSQVKYIATATIGYDHLDLDFLESRGIRWSNAPGCNSGSVMQYIASSLSYIVDKTGRPFHDLTLGIIGVGHVGKKVEKLALLTGMGVLLNDPPREREEGPDSFTDLETLLRESDVVTIHVPLNRTGRDKTFHIADHDFLGKMKKASWLINTSRGEVVNTAALRETLVNRNIAGAILDVWENEPDIDRMLLELSDIGTPHIAGYSLDGKANGTSQSVRAVSRFFSLGMDDWYPGSIPSPPDSIIQVENSLLSLEQLVKIVFNHTYDIMADSYRLNGGPEHFEKLRDNYPQRREFGAYSVKFADPADRNIEILQKLGFKTTNNI